MAKNFEVLSAHGEVDSAYYSCAAALLAEVRSKLIAMGYTRCDSNGNHEAVVTTNKQDGKAYLSESFRYEDDGKYVMIYMHGADTYLYYGITDTIIEDSITTYAIPTFKYCLLSANTNRVITSSGMQTMQIGLSTVVNDNIVLFKFSNADVLPDLGVIKCAQTMKATYLSGSSFTIYDDEDTLYANRNLMVSVTFADLTDEVLCMEVYAHTSVGYTYYHKKIHGLLQSSGGNLLDGAVYNISGTDFMYSNPSGLLIEM